MKAFLLVLVVQQQLSSGGGCGLDFPLLATRCNADSSQGYTVMDDDAALSTL